MCKHSRAIVRERQLRGSDRCFNFALEMKEED